MTLNPQVAALLEALSAYPSIDYGAMTAEGLRAVYDQPMAASPPLPMASVRDITLDLPGRRLPARLYVPEGAGEPAPLTLFCHGGGWVVGTLETHDATCRALARESGSAFLSVGYRLAPEHPYPAPLDDCYEALLRVAEEAPALGCDSARLAVAGDSAGASLAAAVALLARDRGGPALRHQLLLYPVTDRDFSTGSYRENGGGQYFLGAEGMAWFWRQYVGDASLDAVPLAAPLRWSNVAGLPAATIITAQYDPLRDEGMAFADRLAAAGVPVDARIAPGMIHGFIGMMDAVPDAWEWIRLAGARLRAALA